MNAAQDASLVTRPPALARAWKYDWRRKTRSIWTQVRGRNKVFAVYNDREETVSVAVLSIESKRTKAVDLNKFVRRLAEQNGNRRIQLDALLTDEHTTLLR